MISGVRIYCQKITATVDSQFIIKNDKICFQLNRQCKRDLTWAGSAQLISKKDIYDSF